MGIPLVIRRVTFGIIIQAHNVPTRGSGGMTPQKCWVLGHLTFLVQFGGGIETDYCYTYYSSSISKIIHNRYGTEVYACK